MKEAQKEYLAKLKMHRVERGFSQHDISEVLGMEQSGYGRIERGAQSLDIDRAITLAKLYGISLSELIGDGRDSGLASEPAWAYQSRTTPKVINITFQLTGEDARTGRFLARLASLLAEFSPPPTDEKRPNT